MWHDNHTQLVKLNIFRASEVMSNIKHLEIILLVLLAVEKKIQAKDACTPT